MIDLIFNCGMAEDDFYWCGLHARRFFRIEEKEKKVLLHVTTPTLGGSECLEFSTVDDAKKAARRFRRSVGCHP